MYKLKFTLRNFVKLLAKTNMNTYNKQMGIKKNYIFKNVNKKYFGQTAVQRCACRKSIYNVYKNMHKCVI